MSKKNKLHTDNNTVEDVKEMPFIPRTISRWNRCKLWIQVKVGNLWFSIKNFFSSVKSKVVVGSIVVWAIVKVLSKFAAKVVWSTVKFFVVKPLKWVAMLLWGHKVVTVAVALILLVILFVPVFQIPV